MSQPNQIRKLIVPALVPLHRIGKLPCPDCNVLMIPYTCENVVVDKCPNCEGIWFDDKELGIFRKALGKFDLEQVKIIARSPEPGAEIISSCPRCVSILYEVKYSYNTKVIIKRCESCHGVWLPLHQTINMIELAKISQAIAPHVEVLANVAKNMELQRQRNKQLKELGTSLTQRIPLWRIYLIHYVGIILPLYDDNPRSRTPWVTIGIIAVNIFVFVAMMFSNEPAFGLYRKYAMIPSKILEGENLGTLLSSMFMHVGLFHLVGNLFFLWTFGDNVEEAIGWKKFIVFYVLCGLGADALHVLSSPSSGVPTLGASGAISGIMGAYILLFPQVSIKTLVFGAVMDIPAWIYLGGWFALQLLWGVIYFGGQGGGIAWWAHIGGFVVGLALIFTGLRLRLIEKRERVRMI